MIDVIPRQAQQSPSSTSASSSSSPAPESFDHLRETFRLELVIDRWPRGEDSSLAVHFGANEGGTAAYSVEVERFGDGGSNGGVESGGESQIRRRVGRKGGECEEGRVGEVRVVRGELGGVGRRERGEVEAVGRVVLVAC